MNFAISLIEMQLILTAFVKMDIYGILCCKNSDRESINDNKHSFTLRNN